MFHPSVNDRIEKVGKAYEEMIPVVHQLFLTFQDFCDKEMKQVEKFMALNKHHLELEKQPEIPKQVLDERLEKSMAIADILRKGLPAFRQLIYETKPLFEEIFNFKEVFVSEGKRLVEYKNDKGRSITIIKNLEESFKMLEYKHREIKRRYDNVKKTSDEAMKIYQSLIN